MKCCSMKLEHREKLMRVVHFEHAEKFCRRILVDSCRYSFEDDSKVTEKSDTEDRPYLSILDISLPLDIVAFNTGSSIEKWVKRRPRFKFLRRVRKSEIVVNADVDSLDVPNLIERLENETRFLEGTQVLESPPDIHPDIKRLLAPASVTLVEEEKLRRHHCRSQPDCKSKRRRKKKKMGSVKNDEEIEKEISEIGRRTVSKTVSFSLSKPASPETEQVIRIDIVSNHHSMEVEISKNAKVAVNDDEDPKQVREASVLAKERDDILLQLLTENKQEGVKDLIVESKRIVLYRRD